jgi:hypothetical protein
VIPETFHGHYSSHIVQHRREQATKQGHAIFAAKLTEAEAKTTTIRVIFEIQAGFIVLGELRVHVHAPNYRKSKKLTDKGDLVSRERIENARD